MKLWTLSLALLSSAALAQTDPMPAVGSENDGGRVVGGIAAPVGSAPWQVEIYWTIAHPPEALARDRMLRDNDPDKKFYDTMAPWELTHSCGGSLIARDWVLTAAHCVSDDKRSFLTSRRVRIGTQNVTRGGATFAIDRVAIHAKYDKQNHRNDIALIHIVADAETAAIDPDRIAAIPLIGDAPTDPPLAINDEVAVTGWGLTKIEGGENLAKARDGTVNHGSPVLQLLTPLYVLDKARCERVSPYSGKMWPGTLCVGARAVGKDACSGDSGGPLTRGDMLVGVVSWGFGCGLQGVPGIYSDIGFYRDWIGRARRVRGGRVTPVA